MFAQNFPSFSSGSSTPFANQDCWSCRESSDQLCAPPRVFPICIFYCRVSNSFSKHLLSPCWSQEHYTRHLYIKMNHSCLCFQELAVKWRRWCVFKWAHKVKRDKTKQNKTLSIIAARGGENFREVMATSPVETSRSIKPMKSPLDLVPRTDVKAIQLGQQGQKLAGVENSSESHPLKCKPEDYHFGSWRSS